MFKSKIGRANVLHVKLSLLTLAPYLSWSVEILVTDAIDFMK